MFEDYKKRIPQVIFENPDELISGAGHQKLLLDGVDLVEAELNKKLSNDDFNNFKKDELVKKLDNTSFDTYKKEQGRVNDSKVDKESYKQDLDTVIDRINASDAGVSKNKQELNGIKKLLGEAADSSKVIGTAKGGGVITFPSNVLTNASPRYRVNGATDDEFKSVQIPMRIKSVGENLWNNDISNSKYKYVGGHNNYVQLSSNFYYKTYSTIGKVNSKFVGNDIIFEYIGHGNQNCKITNLKPNTTYYISYIPDWDQDRAVYRIFGEILGYESLKNRRVFAEVESNSLGEIETIFAADSSGNTTTNLIYKDVVLSEKEIDFIPYTESIAYANSNLSLKSVGESSDYIENGKLYQNIKRHYFSKSDEWTLRDDYEGANYRYYMTLPFEYKATGAGVENELLCNNFTPTSNVASVLTERESGTIALYRENASTVYLTLDKKVDDVNSVIPEGTFVDVILPQTEVTNLDTSGMVVARPNGTVFIEPVANLTAFYNNGLDVSTLTIEEVESFSTFKDGNYQELDVSKVSIKDGKLTHPDAVNGLCYLVYRHDNAPIYGNNEVDYYNSEKTLKSPNGKVWKKVEEATDEGELVTKLEEVK